VGFVNPRAICPNCGAKIHTQGGVVGTATGLGHRTGTVCPQCGVALSGKVGWDNKAKLEGQPSDGAQVASLVGASISAGGRAIERRRVRKATGTEVSPADFQKMVAEEVADSSSVIVQPTKKQTRLTWALMDAGFNRKEIKAFEKKIKAGPIEVRPEPHSQLEVLVAKLKKLGIEYELMHDRDMSRSERFDVVVTVPAEVLTALREKKTKELKELFGLERTEASEARNLLIGDWRLGSEEVEPDKPTVIAPGILEKFANETKVLMEKLGARVDLVPSVDGATEPRTDEDLQSPAGPGPSPEPSEDVLAQIEKLGQLHDTGVLTDEEFQAKKAELLQRL
jgi:hypothetical protein